MRKAETWLRLPGGRLHVASIMKHNLTSANSSKERPKLAREAIEATLSEVIESSLSC